MNIILLSYAGNLLIGAFMGLKAGSRVSFIMGAVSSVLVCVGNFLIDTNASAAYWLLTLVSAALSVVFTIRLVKTHKFIPSGMLLSVSILILFMVVYQLLGG